MKNIFNRDYYRGHLNDGSYTCSRICKIPEEGLMKAHFFEGRDPREVIKYLSANTGDLYIDYLLRIISNPRNPFSLPAAATALKTLNKIYPCKNFDMIVDWPVYKFTRTGEIKRIKTLFISATEWLDCPDLIPLFNEKYFVEEEDDNQKHLVFRS